MSTWSKVEHSLAEAERQIEEASSEEQFQAIGLLCRETLISLGQVVYNPVSHRTPDGVEPSKTDAKRMLEAYIQHELSGSENQAARKWARASLDLANELQHKRTATFRDAALCLEATKAVVRLIGVVSGYRLETLMSPFEKVKRVMPELIREMKEDLESSRFTREFFIASRKWLLNISTPAFVYYFEDHEDLQGKVQILENYGLVIDVTTGNLKRYRMTEEFVDAILGL